MQTHADTLLALAPDHPLGLFSAATAQVVAGRYEQAEASLRRALRGNDYGPVHNDLAWLLSCRGDHTEALKHAPRAVELLPNDNNALDTKAMIHLRLGQNDEAVEAIDRALALRGAVSAAMAMNAVEIYTAAGKSAKAEPILEGLRNIRETLPEDVRARLDKFADQQSGRQPIIRHGSRPKRTPCPQPCQDDRVSASLRDNYSSLLIL